MRPYLVYCSARDGRCLAGLYGPTRHFDVAINNWSAAGKTWDTAGVDHAFGEDLEKLEGAARLLGRRMLDYQAVALLDDDVEISLPALDNLFAAGCALGLSIWQAALTRDSTWSYRVTRQQDRSLVRLTDIVEIMMPVFSRAALERFLPTFSENQSGWGLDFLWAERLGHQGLAVFDRFAARHRRPITSGQRKMRNGSTSNQEYEALRKKYGIQNKQAY